jgi:alpha/beta superfamily hydrolase
VKRSLETSDGLALEAEWSAAHAPARAVAVLCHPHPQYGGTMRSIVTSALFENLPAHGFDCLRFNFRGVERSEGDYSGGVDEPRDVIAALDAAVQAAPGLPLALVGWSFGADMALVVADARVAAWVAIAPPLRFRPSTDYSTVAHDARPKLLLLAAHDEYRAPDDVEAEVATWNATRVEVIAGASHFFVGRTDQVVDRTVDYLRALNPSLDP